jgi:hypothetical protein
MISPASDEGSFEAVATQVYSVLAAEDPGMKNAGSRKYQVGVEK